MRNTPQMLFQTYSAIPLCEHVFAGIRQLQSIRLSAGALRDEQLSGFSCTAYACAVLLFERSFIASGLTAS